MNRVALFEDAVWIALRDHFKIVDGYSMDYFAMTIKDGSEPFEFARRTNVPAQKNVFWVLFDGLKESDQQFVSMRGFEYVVQILISPICTEKNWRTILQNVKKDFIDFMDKNGDFGGTCAEAKINSINTQSVNDESRYKDVSIDLIFTIFQEG